MPRSRKVLDHTFQLRIVKAFAERHVEFHAESSIHGFKLRLRKPDHFMPDLQVFLISPLELYEFLFRRIEGDCVHPGARRDQLVNAFHFAERIGRERSLVELSFPAQKQHPKLRPPVPDVIVPHNIVADESRDPRQGVAEERGADMADVHRLGDVRRTEVDHDSPRNGGRGHTQPRIVHKVAEAFRQPRGLEAKIDKTGARDFGRLREGGDIELADDLLGKLAWVGALLLREDHGDIGLIIAKPCISGGCDLWRRFGNADKRRTQKGL